MFCTVVQNLCMHGLLLEDPCRLSRSEPGLPSATSSDLSGIVDQLGEQAYLWMFSTFNSTFNQATCDECSVGLELSSTVIFLGKRGGAYSTMLFGFVGPSTASVSQRFPISGSPLPSLIRIESSTDHENHVGQVARPFPSQHWNA